ncbi:MAG: acyltransferase [Croceibacterium sp.]
MVANPSATSRLPDGGRFVALDALRGVAALGIAVHHINGRGPLFDMLGRLDLGLAVDFFFVLSGFVIAASYGARLARGFSIARFMLLRYGRVWPLQAVMVAAYLALELVYLAWHGGGAVGGRAPFTEARDPAMLPASLLLVQAFVFPLRDSWNTQAWSISVEVGLYLAAAGLWRMLGRAATAPAVVAALAALVLLDLERTGGWDQVLRGIGGFGLGMGCWALWGPWARLRIGRALATLLEAFVVLGAAAIVAGYTAMLTADLLFAATVLVFAREGGALSRLCRTAPLVWLGTLSYSLYMVHGFVFGRIFDGLALVQLQIGAHWVEATVGGIDRLVVPAPVALAVMAAMLAAALAAAWLVWRWVEAPAREWSRRRAAAMGVGREERRAPTI